MTYPPYPTGIAPNKADPSAKGLQIALYHCGYWTAGIPFADNYGPATQSSVRKFYGDHLLPADAAISPSGWAKLMAQAYDPEPVQDMTHTTYGGRTVNARTARMLAMAGVTSLTQGSYNKGVSASAGTHDGGGVVDVTVSNLSTAQRSALVLRLREVGFAAWLRTPAEGFPYHIHACAIGDREMAPAAVKQVAAFFNGRNGLADNGPDTFHGVRPVPAWALFYRR